MYVLVVVVLWCVHSDDSPFLRSGTLRRFPAEPWLAGAAVVEPESVSPSKYYTVVLLYVSVVSKVLWSLTRKR